jgi:hypothetical protein
VPSTLGKETAVAGGYGHSLALTSDGTVVAWGWNDAGQATVPAGLSNVVAVPAGGAHALALRADGTVTAWGHPADGRTTVPAGLSVDPATGWISGMPLEVGTWTATVSASNAYGTSTAPLKIIAETVAAWGRNTYGLACATWSPSPPAGTTRWR